jgi:hypothetical protein
MSTVVLLFTTCFSLVAATQYGYYPPNYTAYSVTRGYYDYGAYGYVVGGYGGYQDANLNHPNYLNAYGNTLLNGYGNARRLLHDDNSNYYNGLEYNYLTSYGNHEHGINYEYETTYVTDVFDPVPSSPSPKISSPPRHNNASRHLPSILTVFGAITLLVAV